jgi:hypothetical protein
MFHEERDTQSGSLEADDEREERMTTVGTKLKAITLSAAGRSALRYRPIEERDEYADEEEAPRRVYRPRAVVRNPQNSITRAPQPQSRRPAPINDEEDSPYMSQRRQAAEYGGPTDEDEMVHPDLRGVKAQKAQTGKLPKRKLHPLFWIGVTLLIAFLAWQAATTVPGWFTTTFVDPGTYGPTHGTTLTIALGNGDSAITPSTLIATNINGQVSLLKLFPGDAKKNMTFTGPNLAVMNFPDAGKAEIALSSPAPGKVQVTIWSDQWDRPFHRYGVSFELTQDGKGGLTQVGTLTVQP